MFLQVASIILPLFSSSPSPDAACAMKPDAKAPKIAAVAVRAPRKETKEKNAVLEVSLDSKPEFRSLVLNKGGEKLVAKDDGVYPDLKAGDGVFAVLDHIREAPKTTKRGSFSNGEGEVSMLKWKVKFKLTACPADCTSLLGGSCWICVDVTEVEVGN